MLRCPLRTPRRHAGDCRETRCRRNLADTREFGALRERKSGPRNPSSSSARVPAKSVSTQNPFPRRKMKTPRRIRGLNWSGKRDLNFLTARAVTTRRRTLFCSTARIPYPFKPRSSSSEFSRVLRDSPPAWRHAWRRGESVEGRQCSFARRQERRSGCRGLHRRAPLRLQLRRHVLGEGGQEVRLCALRQHRQHVLDNTAGRGRVRF